MKRAIYLPVMLAVAAAGLGAPAAALLAPRDRPVSLLWLGQACFLIQTGTGSPRRWILIDPVPAKLGYKGAEVHADVVVVTHEHFDHNAVGEVLGKPVVLREPKGHHVAAGIDILGIPAYHDNKKGKLRGQDTIIVFEMHGIRFCHLGDLGSALTKDQVKKIGQVDVLMIPVGGYYTMGLGDVERVIAQLKPKVVIPMHYRTKAVASSLRVLAPVDDFIKGKKNVKMIDSNEIYLLRNRLPKQPEIWVVQWEPRKPRLTGFH